MLPAILAGVQIATTVGGAIAGQAGQRKAARQEEESVRQALRLKRRDLSIRAVEEMQAAGQARDLAERQAQGVSGTAAAAAGSAGVRGVSVGDILGEISGDLARVYSSIDFQSAATLDQIERLRSGAEAEAQARLGSIQRPSLIQTMLQIGGGALDAYSFYQRSTRPVGANITEEENP